jgi:hypothetical protein
VAAVVLSVSRPCCLIVCNHRIRVMVSEASLRVETTRWCYLVVAIMQFSEPSKRATSLSLLILTGHFPIPPFTKLQPEKAPPGIPTRRALKSEHEFFLAWGHKQCADWEAGPFLWNPMKLFYKSSESVGIPTGNGEFPSLGLSPRVVGPVPVPAPVPSFARRRLSRKRQPLLHRRRGQRT